MSKPIKREKWGKPKLIVITRGGLKETVLLLCKATGYIEPSGPNYYADYCGVSKLCPSGCEVRGAS